MVPKIDSVVKVNLIIQATKVLKDALKRQFGTNLSMNLFKEKNCYFHIILMIL